MSNTFIRLAYRGLVRNKKRTLMTAMAFVIGYVGLFLLAGYIYRIEKVLRYQALYQNMNGHLRVQKKGAENYWASPEKYLITKQQIEEIKQQLSPHLPELDFVGEKLKASSQIVYGDKTFPVFVDGLDMPAEILARTNKDFRTSIDNFFDYIPQPFQKTADGHFGISVTPELSRLMGVPVESERTPPNFEAQMVGLDFESNLNAIDVIVNHVHQTSSAFMRNFSVEMDIADVRRLTNVDGASEINIFLKPGSDISQALVKVTQALDAGFPGQYKIERFDTDEVSPEYAGNMGFLLVMMFFFLILIGGSVILSVLNVLTMSIIERSAEIGTLLSLGFSRLQVRVMFVIEGFLLGLAGILLGALFSVIIAIVINQMKFTFTPPGALGTAFVQVDIDFALGLTIAILMLIPLVVSSFFLTRKQTQKKLVQLLNEVEGGS